MLMSQPEWTRQGRGLCSRLPELNWEGRAAYSNKVCVRECARVSLRADRKGEGARGGGGFEKGEGEGSIPPGSFGFSSRDFFFLK